MHLNEDYVLKNAVRIEYNEESILSDSALFLVRNHPFSKEFLDLITALRNNNADKQYCKVKVGQFIAYFKNSEWYRAYVVAFVSRDKIRVFLIDYGFCEDIPYSYGSCQPLPPRFSPLEFESQSYKISLYGMKPLSEKIDLLEGARKEQYDNWQTFHSSFMRHKMLEADKIFFQNIFQEGEIKFGYIFVEINRQFYSLNNLLIEKDWAIECNNEAFEKEQIPLLLKYFRKERTFDQKISVRRMIWPTASFWLEENIFKQKKISSRKSSTSNYGSFSNLSSTSDYDKSQEYVRSVHSAASDIDDNSLDERIHASTEKIDDANLVVDSDETSEYGSEREAQDIRRPINYVNEEKGARNNSINYLEEEAPMPIFTRVRDEILVVGNDHHFKPVISCDSILDEKTRQMMRKIGVRGIVRNQGFMIPAMLSRVPKDIILVDAPKTGKTVSCVIALVSLLRETTKRRTCSPRSIIVLPYSAQCEFVRNRCVELITGCKGEGIDEGDLRVAMAYGCGQKLEYRNLLDITRGCDILVCTPRRLLRLLENTSGFDLNQLEYAIFDEFHILSQSFTKEVLQIMTTIRDLKRKNLRRVFISDSSQAVKPIVKDWGLQMLLIPCFLEAALFVNFNFEIHYKDDARKMVDIKERLSSDGLRSKIVVVVLNHEEESLEQILQMKSTLEDCGKPIYVLEHSMVGQMDDMVNTVRDDISCGGKPVIFCTDFRLSTLTEKIYDADCLIHFSLPDDVGTFRQRYAAILHRVQDLAVTAIEPSTSTASNTQKPEVVLYINEKHTEQFPRLLNIMSQLTVVLPSWVKDILKKIAHKKEIDREEICQKLLQFGQCDDRKRCTKRHILIPAKDQPDPLLPRSGRVNVEIVQVYSPTHFRVRLIKYKKDYDEKWTLLPTMNQGTLTLKMKAHFAKNKKVAAEFVQVGDLVAIEDCSTTVPSYKRVRVMEITGENPRMARLKFVDYGTETTKNVVSLFVLPPDLASVPETTIDVFLCNLRPIDEDITWGTIFTETIQKRIDEQKERGTSFVGKIQLVIGRSMWLDPLQCEVYSKELRSERVEFWFTKYLLTEKLAIKNQGHVEMLRQMCKSTGIEYLETSVSFDNCEAPSDQPQTDFTTTNTNPRNVQDISNGAKGCKSEELRANLQNEYSSIKKSSHVTCVTESQVGTESSIFCGSRRESNKGTEGAPDRYGGSPHNGIQQNLSATNNISSGNAQGMSNSPISNIPNGGSSPSRRSFDPPCKQEQAEAIRPTLFWKQDSTSITLTIMKNISENYSVTTPNSKRLCFRGMEGSTLYAFDEQFAHCFNRWTMSHKKSGVSIVIKLEKLVKDRFYWKQLLKSESQESIYWVKYKDDSLLVDSDDDDDNDYIRTEPINYTFCTRQSGRSRLDEINAFRSRPDDFSDGSTTCGSDTDHDGY